MKFDLTQDLFFGHIEKKEKLIFIFDNYTSENDEFLGILQNIDDVVDMKMFSNNKMDLTVYYQAMLML